MKMVRAGQRSVQLMLSAMAIFAVAGCAAAVSSGRYVNLSILGTVSLPAGYQGIGIAVQGTTGYVATEAIGSQAGARSLVIVSLATPSAPKMVSATSSGLASDMGGIAVSGNYAYVPFESATGTNFQVWNVSNPVSPEIVGSTSIACPQGMYPFNAPAVYGNDVYVACWQSEVTATGAFAIVNVSNPAAPAVASMVPVTGTYQPISFAIWKQNLYVVATQGGSTSDYALMYSIENPASPALEATVSVPHSPQWVAAFGAMALVPIYDGKELQVVDFSNPASPQELSASLGSCHPANVVVYQANLALASCDTPGGVAEVDVAAADHPVYLGTTLSGTVFNYLVPSGSYVYGVDESGNFIAAAF
jgi:hypothetical protein